MRAVELFGGEGAPWASPRGLSLCVPWQYTYFLGLQAADHIRRSMAESVGLYTPAKENAS